MLQLAAVWIGAIDRCLAHLSLLVSEKQMIIQYRYWLALLVASLPRCLRKKAWSKLRRMTFLYPSPLRLCLCRLHRGLFLLCPQRLRRDLPYLILPRYFRCCERLRHAGRLAVPSAFSMTSLHHAGCLAVPLRLRLAALSHPRCRERFRHADRSTVR